MYDAKIFMINFVDLLDQCNFIVPCTVDDFHLRLTLSQKTNFLSDNPFRTCSIFLAYNLENKELHYKILIQTFKPKVIDFVHTFMAT